MRPRLTPRGRLPVEPPFGSGWPLVALLAVACSSSPAPEPPAATPSAAAPSAAPTAPASTTPDQPPSTGPGTYDQDGKVPYTTEAKTVQNGATSFRVVAYVPQGPGPHPAVSFSCGSSQAAEGYVAYGKRLASHGIAVFLKDDPGALTRTVDILPDAVFVVDKWIPSTYPSTIDTKRIGLAGHSGGGGLSLLAAEGGLKGKVVAWFGLDPVDNQFGFGPGAYARSELGKIGVPTAYLGASVTSNCAPAADSYPMLFPKSPSPSVLIVGQGAGHTQLQAATACNACAVCSPGGTAKDDVVLGYSARYFAAFFARELLGDAAVGATFQGAGGPADVAAGRVTISAK